MDLFISSEANDRMSLALEIFVIYIRGVQRNIVNLNALSSTALKALKLDNVPTLLKNQTDILEGKEVQNQ
jgi:hypothetical protein